MTEPMEPRERLVYILGIVTVGAGIFDGFEQQAWPMVVVGTVLFGVNLIGMRWHHRWPVALPTTVCWLNSASALMVAWTTHAGGAQAIQYVWLLAGLMFFLAGGVFVVRGRRRASAPPARNGDHGTIRAR